MSVNMLSLFLVSFWLRILQQEILIFDVGFSYSISQELVSLSGALTII